MNYTRKPQRFVSEGMDLNHPVDLVIPGKFPFLRNVRSYQEGRFDTRPGLTIVNGGSPFADTNIHTGYRMNDYLAGSFIRFLGAGTKLYSGTTYPTLLDSGYSGNPLSIVPYLPAQSANGFAYIADASKMAKVNVSSQIFNIGITPPKIIPGAELISPAYTTPTGSDNSSPFNSAGAWGNSGSSTTPALNPVTMPGRLVGVQIGTILYLSGASGWACIAPTGGNPSQIVAGMRIQIGTGGAGTAPPTGNVEYATVESVNKIYSSGSPTIGQIIYDSGTSGLCTIAPSVNMAGLERNGMLELAGEWVRIISVTSGNNGISSFRCSTSGTHTAGEAITLPANGSFFVYLSLTHTAGEYLWCSVYQFQINPGSKGGQGQVYSNAANGSPWSLAIANGRPLTPDDFIHLSMWVDHPEYLIECQLTLDVDSTTTVTHTAQDGTKNAFFVTFRGSNFQQFVANLQQNDVERQKAIQLDLQGTTNVPLVSPKAPPTPLGSGQSSTPVDVASTADSNPPLPILGSASSQLYTGASQWTELKFRIADLLPIGADKTADLSVIKAIILNFTVSNNIYVSMAGMWSGGTYGPDSSNDLTPLIYRYRYRSSTIGSRSLPGPAMRTGIQAHRQGVLLTAVASTDPQVDKIDFERLGGANLEWHYVGTCPNSSPSLEDDQLSAAVQVNAPLETDTYQPFTLSAAPKVGLQATVAGSAISLTSGTIDVNMVRGTTVLVNKVPTALYAVPSSSTLFHVTDSMGFGTGVEVDIYEPIVSNQPLPFMWGPFYDMLLAVGNPLDPGSVYFTKPGDPDSSSDANRLTITSPSETLMGGFIFDTKAYVFSDKRLFQLIPTQDPQSPLTWNEIPNGKGLFYRWGITVGPKPYNIASDGIYDTFTGENISRDIQPLFPQGDKPGFAANGLNPIDMTKPLRLTYFNDYLFFDYTDSLGTGLTLVYDIKKGGWYSDEYFEGIHSVLCHWVEDSVSSGEETRVLFAGSNSGYFSTVSGTNDAAQPIACEIDTPAYNADDFRSEKLWGDVVFDLNPLGASISVVPWLNNYTSSLAGTTYTFAARTVSDPFDLPKDTFARNLGFKITWSSATVQPSVYSWEPSFLIRPEDTANRATDWDDAEYNGAKFLQGFLLEVDTSGVTRTFQLQVDNVNVGAPYTVNTTRQQWVPFVVNPAVIGSNFRVVPTDGALWRLYSIKWVWEPSPELVTYWETQTTNHDIPGFQFLKDGYIAHYSTADIVLTIQVDGVSFVLTIPNSGGKYVKTYFVVPNVLSRTPKGKLFKYILSSSAGFRLFQKDSEIRVHPWGGNDSYLVRHPFGDISRVNGARI